jgi:HlyD family secretion protein
MRTWIWIVIAVVVVAAAAAGFTSLRPGVPVEAASVKRGPVREYIDEEGKTRLIDTFLITMPYDGRIEPIELVEGTPVTKGQVVARISPIDVDLQIAEAQAIVDRLKASIKENDDVSVETTALQQTVNMVEAVDRTVEAAEARVKSGQAQLDFAEKRLTRIRGLQRSGASTLDELDQAEVSEIDANVQAQRDNLDLRSTQAMRAAMALMPTMVRQYIQRKQLTHAVLDQQLTEAEVNLREVQKNAKLATMESPVDGVVLKREISNERQVAAGTVLLEIGRWEDLEIEADVLSQDVVRVKPGQAVEIHGPTIGPVPAKATVSRVFPAGFTKTSSLGIEQQRVKVIMKFTPEDLARLRKTNDIGVHYRVRVRIFTAEDSGGLVIPRSALFRGARNDWRVFVIRDGRAHLQPVKIGLANDLEAQVLGGLREGEQVILAPESNLAESQRVEVLSAGESDEGD